MRLWEIRKKEGFTQADLAAAIGRDRGWVSKALRGPGNWTLRTIGAFIVGLNGELDISAHPLEEVVMPARNYDAYGEYGCDPVDEISGASHSLRDRPQSLKARSDAMSDLPDYLKAQVEKSKMAAA